MKKIITVLSVRQPWAWLIIQGFKSIENRTWRTNYRGELYIHAGKSFDWEALDRLEWEMPGIANEIKKHFRLNRSTRLTSYKLHPDTLSEFGAIIGRVTLEDCVTNSHSIWAEEGCYHWKVTAPFPITPIPMSGQLGLFKAEIEVPE